MPSPDLFLLPLKYYEIIICNIKIILLLQILFGSLKIEIMILKWLKSKDLATDTNTFLQPKKVASSGVACVKNGNTSYNSSFGEQKNNDNFFHLEEQSLFFSFTYKQ